MYRVSIVDSSNDTVILTSPDFADDSSDRLSKIGRHESFGCLIPLIIDEKIKPGNYTLVFSIIGFEAYSQDITIADADIALPDVLMFPKTISLSGVTIKPEQNRERNLDWFRFWLLRT